MDYNKIEDAALEKASGIFWQSAIDCFNIDNTKIIATAEAEIKNNGDFLFS